MPPAWGGRFVIDPNSPEGVAQIDIKIMLDVAVGKWKEDGADVLAMLQASKKVCFEHAPYCSAKTGKAYAGFEGKFNLGTRSEKVKPTVLNKFGEKITDNREIEQLIYSGCYTHSKVEFWGEQDNKFGRRYQRHPARGHVRRGRRELRRRCRCGLGRRLRGPRGRRSTPKSVLVSNTDDKMLQLHRAPRDPRGR